MDKLTLSRICAYAGPALLGSLAEKAAEGQEAALLKGPEKTMVLLQVREPARRSRFYLGELLAVRYVVELVFLREDCSLVALTRKTQIIGDRSD